MRYFTDGAVLGGKEFVNDTFATARKRFGPTRKNGAWKLRGHASQQRGVSGVFAISKKLGSAEDFLHLPFQHIR